jgi:hypothetical protein
MVVRVTRVALFALVATAADRPSNPYIDRGACPFECCLYREWFASKPLAVVDRPEGRRVVARLREGERVTALTGETRSIPLPMKSPVGDSEAGIHQGDRIYVLHYEGEGMWAVWFRGKRADAELSNLKVAPKTEWWAKIRTARGVVGWVRAERNFQNQDGCG